MTGILDIVYNNDNWVIKVTEKFGVIVECKTNPTRTVYFAPNQKWAEYNAMLSILPKPVSRAVIHTFFMIRLHHKVEGLKSPIKR